MRFISKEGVFFSEQIENEIKRKFQNNEGDIFDFIEMKFDVYRFTRIPDDNRIRVIVNSSMIPIVMGEPTKISDQEGDKNSTVSIEQKEEGSEKVYDRGKLIGYYYKEKSLFFLAEGFLIHGALNDKTRKEIYNRIEKAVNFLIEISFNAKIEKELSDFSYNANKENKEYISKLANQATIDIAREIESAKTEVRNAQDKIKNAMASIVTNNNNLTKYSRIIDNSAQYKDEISNKLIKEIELICDLFDVKGAWYSGNVLTIITNYMPIIEPVNRKEYAGNVYKITCRLDNSEVRFFSILGYGRSGYWTVSDPHPHVNGGNGEACLGNTSSTIAELCAMKELYALSVILIEFLKYVNIYDSAGRKVVNYPLNKPEFTQFDKKCDYKGLLKELRESQEQSGDVCCVCGEHSEYTYEHVCGRVCTDCVEDNDDVHFNEDDDAYYGGV